MGADCSSWVHTRTADLSNRGRHPSARPGSLSEQIPSPCSVRPERVDYQVWNKILVIGHGQAALRWSRCGGRRRCSNEPITPEGDPALRPPNSAPSTRSCPRSDGSVGLPDHRADPVEVVRVTEQVHGHDQSPGLVAHGGRQRVEVVVHVPRSMSTNLSLRPYCCSAYSGPAPQTE